MVSRLKLWILGWRSPSGLWWSANRLREEGDRAGAAELFRRAINTGHANWTPRAEIDLAELLEEEGDVTGAREHYQRAIDFPNVRTDPVWPRRAAVKLEVMLTQHGELDSARAVHDRATGQGRLDERMRFAFDRAFEWERRGNLSAAAESLREILAEDPTRAPSAALKLGHVLRHAGDLDGARAAFQAAVDTGDPAVAPQAAGMIKMHF